MTVELEMKSLPARLIFLLITLAICTLLVWVILNQFIVGTLADERLPIERDRLASTVASFPDSPRVNARYARLELLSIDRNLDKALSHATRAVQLSPYNYNYRLLLGSIEELRGNRAVAEQMFRKAVELAPANPDPHWQLANVLLRQKKIDEALPEFRLATTPRRNYLGATHDLIWRASGGNVAAVEAVTSDSTEAKMALAQFLLSKSQTADAVRVFGSIDREARLADPQSGAILDSMIGAGALTTARELWASLVGKAPSGQEDSQEDSQSAALIWNGSFESDVVKNFAQFDWHLSRSDYAKLSFDGGTAHSGSRSLRIDFAGKDTTRLDNEIKQTLVLVPGARYRLEYWTKTDKFSAPEGPRVVLTETKTNTVAAKSEPLASGTADWTRTGVEFIAPAQSGAGMLLTIKRLPQFSYDEPTRGTVWFDDFKITKSGGQGSVVGGR